MNKNFGYPTTMYESILAQIVVEFYLVLLTIYAFTMEIVKAKFGESSNGCHYGPIIHYYWRNIFLLERCIFGRK